MSVPGRKNDAAAEMQGDLHPPGDVMAHTRLQGLAKKHLNRDLAGLFKESTHLRLGVKWAPPPPRTLQGELPAALGKYCLLICSRDVGRSACRELAAAQLAAALRKGPQAHRFTCPFGVQNLWIPLIVRHTALGLLLFQAFSCATSKHARKRAAGLGLLPERVDHALMSTRVVKRADFDRAAKLLALIADDVLQHVELDLEREELERSGRALAAQRGLETELRKALKQVHPCIHEEAASPEIDGHAAKLVRKALDFIHERYSHPMQVGEVAEALHMNRSYFSSLFTRHVGIPFRTYLATLRMEKAQDLLRDPTQRIGAVADAVGYTNANSFRLAFKAYTGLSPLAWRDTLNASQ